MLKFKSLYLPMYKTISLNIYYNNIYGSLGYCWERAKEGEADGYTVDIVRIGPGNQRTLIASFGPSRTSQAPISYTSIDSPPTAATLGRLFGNLYGRRTKDWDQHEMWDAGFDGGEFSGAAWDRAREEAWDDCVSHIMHRFNLSRSHVEKAIGEYQHSDEPYIHAAIERWQRQQMDQISNLHELM